MPAWQERLEHERQRRARAGLLRTLPTLDPSLLDFCSNDYLGLSREPEVIAAARGACALHGTGARASRLITGNHAEVISLEHELARFKGCTAALVFPSGYQANLALCATLMGQHDAVFVDRLAHACLVDGVRLSPAKLRVFPHNDLARLDALLAASAAAPARWILADGVYSMDGDLAPLPSLVELAARHDATIILDDAHGTGVVGETGRGTAEHFGVLPREHEDRLIIVATLSKALGAQGGAVCGAAALRDGLINSARPFVYSTGLSPASAAAARAALALIEHEPARVARLHQLVSNSMQALRGYGLDLGASTTAIVPVILGEPESAIAASAELRRRGLLALPIRPPTVPMGTSRLRLTISTVHDDEGMDAAMRMVGEVCAPGGP